MSILPHRKGASRRCDREIHKYNMTSFLNILCTLLGQTEVLLCRDHTNGVGMAHTTAPTLDTDNVVALINDTQLNTVRDTPLQTSVNIFLPALKVEVGLSLSEIEGPYTAVKVRILFSAWVSICLTKKKKKKKEETGINLPVKQRNYG